MRLGRLLPKFLKKVWEASQGTPERAVNKAVGMKPKVQWRLQEIGDAKNREHMLKKATGCE